MFSWYLLGTRQCPVWALNSTNSSYFSCHRSLFVFLLLHGVNCGMASWLYDAACSRRCSMDWRLAPLEIDGTMIGECASLCMSVDLVLSILAFLSRHSSSFSWFPSQSSSQSFSKSSSSRSRLRFVSMFKSAYSNSSFLASHDAPVLAMAVTDIDGDEGDDDSSLTDSESLTSSFGVADRSGTIADIFFAAFADDICFDW
mmetsp:Transcript_29039/g.35367  ORF Transcript_29039/g.35367 Transcript_29039/m.35367 type:complete len:200 (+) Transcript_29039:1345-1944(+)